MSTDTKTRPDAVRLARAALTRLLEPGDCLASATVDALGPERALVVMTGRESIGPSESDLVTERLGDEGSLARRWSAGLERWAPRGVRLDAARDLENMRQLGGGLLTPEDEGWPSALADLGDGAPVGLWFRGNGSLPQSASALAVVGSREATAYGSQVAQAIAAHAVSHGVCVVSGGSYGIDGAAHRAALAAESAESVPTVAVLAGGLDRFYPAGHEELLREVMEAGLLVSELPPGATPTRHRLLHRLLHRNRLIAALAGAIVVVESRWRSGAQNTAGHALALGRGVGAVPGPVTSASSAGCHRLLQEGAAQLVASPEQALALLGAGDQTGCRP